MTDVTYNQIAEKAYGKVVSGVKVGKDGEDLWIMFSDGPRLHFMHYRDCCEDVSIEDIDIDLQDIVGSRLYSIEEASKTGGGYGYSSTWTFYKIQTSSQCATVRWYGESNGYYSEEVDWEYLEAGEQ